MTDSATIDVPRGRTRPACGRGRTGGEPDANRSVGVRVDRLEVRAGRTPLLHDVSLAVHPGELFAVAGVSGAGKSTLLETVAGIRQPAAGAVRFTSTGPRRPGAVVGFVPQDDVIHRDLPLRTGLRYTARLRLPSGLGADELETLVDRVLDELHLGGCAAVRVASLSGGQRKRASIAAELLTRPDVLLLDEPTSGLDPVTAAEVLSVLRELTCRGTTVVFTTHHLGELERADRFAFLGRRGRTVFTGSATDAREALGCDDLAELYRADLLEPAPTPSAHPLEVEVPRAGAGRARSPRRRATDAVVQLGVLTRRNAALLAANRLTLATLVGSPAAVIAMMVVLFPPAGDGTTTAPVQLPFWIAFAAFFFGLTAGLLQIVPEAAVAARERRAGVGATVYVLSKVGALVPVLVAASAGMLVALGAFDRLPTGAGWSPTALAVTTMLIALSALGLGLLASALVRDPSQATLALPMLCFPQVLFAGAVVAVDEMAPAGRLVSHGMSSRFGLEGIIASLGDASVGLPVQQWVVLGLLTASTIAATALVLHRR